jgi:F-type H+-transporting ATPase subunit c
MKKVVTLLFLVALVLMVAAPMAMAADAAAAGNVDYAKAIVLGCSLIAAGLAIGLGTIGAGLGMGQATSGSVNAVGRNPDAQGKVMLTMMVGLAMTESIAIYALVVTLILLYANPIMKYFGA